MPKIEVKTIDALLPQTQCGECGYAGCLPYAEALAGGTAPIDRCPPGGVATVKALGEYLGIDPQPYLMDAENKARPFARAVIREAECIGCTKCIQACPVDAIIGTAKKMHAVIPQDCTGCGLCVEPCPMDCIEMQVLSEPGYIPARAKQRFDARKTRLLRKEHEKQQIYRQKRLMVSEKSTLEKESIQQDIKAKQAYILEALQRVKDKPKQSRS